jgi:hypothetical protein
MGHDLHITRAFDWTDREKVPIPVEEWLDYVRSDPEMRLDGQAEATTSQGETIRYENDGLAVWVAYSGHGRNGNMAWFDHKMGEVVVKNPDEEIIQKMCLIARALRAHVQGDDGEMYYAEGNA